MILETNDQAHLGGLAVTEPEASMVEDEAPAIEVKPSSVEKEASWMDLLASTILKLIYTNL